MLQMERIREKTQRIMPRENTKYYGVCRRGEFSIEWWEHQLNNKKGESPIMGMPVITASETTRDQAITDLIQSVALEETALSHILNAEGEKIQKMVALPDVTPEVLLATNKSVESMVNAVSRLEMILHSKLSSFEGCLCKSTSVKE